MTDRQTPSHSNVNAMQTCLSHANKATVKYRLVNMASNNTQPAIRHQLSTGPAASAAATVSMVTNNNRNDAISNGNYMSIVHCSKQYMYIMVTFKPVKISLISSVCSEKFANCRALAFIHESNAWYWYSYSIRLFDCPVWYQKSKPLNVSSKFFHHRKGTLF